jgi:hypothetical protein
VRLEPVDLARRLTLADLVLRPVGLGWLRPALLALAVLGLVLPELARRPAYWLALAGLAGARVIATWPLADNHAYLLVYWCLALAIAAREEDPGPTLAWSARALLGLAFVLAVTWKVFSPDFLDGRFLRVTLVLDTRLAPFARLAGGLDAEGLRERRAALTRPAPAAGEAGAVESPRFRSVARAASLAVFALELWVAAAFLLPRGFGPARARDAPLIGFCASTYAVAPVSGFGWLLIALGVAQSDPARPRVRVAYLAAFALIFLYRVLSDLALFEPGS